jgi:L-threonylcarbamoyladenylate synthase
MRVLTTTDAAWLDAALAHLRDGGVVALPTETVYGLAAALHRPEGVERIFALKGRPEEKALPWQAASLPQAEAAGFRFSGPARRVAERFWPGPLTLVLPRPASCPPWFAPDSRAVALRIPDHGVALALLEGHGDALAVTSANRSRERECLDAHEVGAVFADVLDLLVIDGGAAPGGVPSTVVDASGEEPVLLREGSLAFALIREVWRG